MYYCYYKLNYVMLARSHWKVYLMHIYWMFQRCKTFLGWEPQCIIFLCTWGLKSKLWAELSRVKYKNPNFCI